MLEFVNFILFYGQNFLAIRALDTVFSTLA